MDYVVYILYSIKHKKNYTGFTSNLILRMASHNIFGKDYTSKFKPWIVIHLEFFNTKEEAMRREKYFKAGRGSILKNKLIAEAMLSYKDLPKQQELN